MKILFILSAAAILWCLGMILAVCWRVYKIERVCPGIINSFRKNPPMTPADAAARIFEAAKKGPAGKRIAEAMKKTSDPK
jgi:hypothetical protein